MATERGKQVSDSIKIVTEPTVYLIGKQTIDNGELDRFLADHEVSHWQTDTEVAGEKLVEVAGRLCYMSFAKPRPGGNSAYIDHILEVGHGSVLEHAVYNLVITGVSRSLTHELVRHRAGMGYSQLSQRYVDESDCAFVMPPLILDLIDWDSVHDSDGGSLDDDDEENEIDELWSEWHKAVSDARDAYERISGIVATRLMTRRLPQETWSDGNAPESWVELNDAIANLPAETRTEFRKSAREASRSVLPNATETKIFVTGNARALRHFIEMRGSLHADLEIRNLALAVHLVLEADSPHIFGDYVRKTTKEGHLFLTADHAKV